MFSPAALSPPSWVASAAAPVVASAAVMAKRARPRFQTSMFIFTRSIFLSGVTGAGHCVPHIFHNCG